MAVPSQVPLELIAGNTWQWDRDLVDYPSPAWVATWYFEMLGSTFNVAGVQSGSKHLATIAAVTTATLKPGRYSWFLRVTAGGEAFTPEKGELVVGADPAAAGSHDPRTWARRTLDAVEAAILKFTTTNIQSYTVNGRAVQRAELQALFEARDRLRAEVAMTDGRGSGRNIKVRFSRG